MFRRQDTVLITSAARSRQWDIHRREVRYLLSMMFRMLCFVLAVVAFHGWLRFVAVAMAVIIPWVAVVIANGGPTPERDRPVSYDPGQPAAGELPALEADPHRVVDSEGWVDDEGWVHGHPDPPGRDGTGLGEASVSGPSG
ncbi:hypothetical protein CcI156_21360 [Frankia sp. CcI156]|uniref:DUF3099 domain-containing protein n=1 Tax=Frankia casuarinae (strain DSM 45818 / CECT 9043 / HFP020203 / CcI3) TaxID=106370 RepID=Q2JBQ8_FRACC|nr:MULTISPECIES: DUF3099 domain-containing protein [Frankia]ABD11284.1 hypothetical protein Francci3_1908 [Frankia casuarinae]ETA00285.1 hypothetical protein CcI6DRAFT_04289 [Frankia sp. CcI6]EYT90121.1 hypothetical protein ThrDRAFT_04254 [Frankia casuarinae]KDA41051.1 hypothetical protein BMG523Draft_04133 [Frankia sp. BMG5.23]OFB40836.1 hypothetical protein Manayef4_18305 [Frankia sp. CgIM4]